MGVTPRIFTAKVMHKRLFPKVNRFNYGVYYIALPLQETEQSGRTGWLGINRRGLLSFHRKDHGARDGSSLEAWIRPVLKSHELDEITQDIVLISMPRVLGYVFNPVSFWLCLDRDGLLRAVLCEVNNTFGETHSYLCAHTDHRPITGQEWMESEKLFHVSPFLEREGTYRFRFFLRDSKLGIWIDYYTEDQEKQLITSLIGKMEPLTPASLRRATWRHPLVTVKTIMLIHWQAIRLIKKGIRYKVKPEQKREKISVTSSLTKM